MSDEATKQQIRRARGKFAAMAGSYSMGVFNDHFFKQGAMLLAVGAGREQFQGYMLMLFTAPYILFSAPAGWLADRFSKHHIVIAAKALEVAAMICGALGMVTGNWALIMMMVFTMGLQSAIFGPSLNGSIPELYPASHVTAANGYLRVFTTAAILLGFALAGFALEWTWRPDVLGVPTGRFNVALGALGVALLGFLASLGVPRRPAASPKAKFPWAGPRDSIRALGRIGRDRKLTTVLAADVFIWSLGSLQLLIINVLGKQQLGYGDAKTSGLMVAELGGIALGGLLAAKLATGRRWLRVLVPSALGLSAAMFLVPVVTTLPEAPRYPALLGALAAGGAAGGLFMVPCESFLQVRPRPDRKGEVLGAANFVTFIGIALSGLVANALNAWVLPSASLAVVGFAALAAAVVLLAVLPREETPLFDALLRGFARFALSLRYRVRASGLQRVAAEGTKGILFLPNHPALIDPVILAAVLHKAFGARFLADQDQIDRFFIRWLARRIDVVPIPDPEKFGPAARQAVQQGLARCVEALRGGDNVVLYPSGHVLRGRLENLAGNSALEYVLGELPDVRVVLVRTRGLWGSRFSYAYGRVPNVAETLRKAAGALVACGVLGAPKRWVRIEFIEPYDLPRGAGRDRLNACLEAFYNEGAPLATYVPYTFWEAGGVRLLGEPDLRARPGDVAGVPQATRRIVADYLRERTGLREVRDGDHLARDLGMDSLARADLLAWLSGEFGLPAGDVEALQTVGDVMLAACGESFSARLKELKPIPARWFAPRRDAGLIRLPEGRTIPRMFLAQARRGAGRAILADQVGGVRTCRDVVTGVLALRRPIASLPGQRVGIMLPAGVAADVTYLATLFAGKTPVMINWTVGPRNLAHCLALVGVERILTAEALVKRLDAAGVDLSAAADRFLFLEHVARRIPRAAKLWAYLRARVSWASLDRAAAGLRPSDPAVVLFTSGSEALPKAVPLTHANILANVGDILALEVLRGGDRLLGILPPFHSFGLTVTTVLPLCSGVAVAHHPDPTEAPTLARLIEAYGTTIMVGTPTFLGAIARSGRPGQLAPLRLAVTGAEKCPQRVYDLLARVNPTMEILEGYGVTECSPIISVNRPGRVKAGTIGRPLASVEHAIVDVNSGVRVPPGEQGMLLVRGPSVFGGYLHYDGASPFVAFEGGQWYRTGDLVSQDADGVLTFRGRLKRFVKLGGEMVSLPAIEAVLESHWPPAAEDEGPALAVEATPDEDHPEIVLFTTRPLDRQTVNRRIRESGLSALHNVRRVVPVEQIPVLGTGKTDYRALRARLADGRR